MRHNKKLFLAIILPIALLIMIGATIEAKKYRAHTPWIGVYSQAIDEDLQEAFDLDRAEGIVVVEVMDDSPADDAGLRRRDVILKFNNKAVMGRKDLLGLVLDTDVGDEIDVVVLRRGKEKTLVVEVGDKRDYDGNVVAIAPGVGSTYRLFNKQLRPHSYIGVGIQNLNDQLGEYFGVDDGAGVLITEIFEDSPAESSGLKAGDVVVEADGEDIYQVTDLTEIIDDKEERDELTLAILRRGDKKIISVEVGEDIYGMNSFSVPNVDFNIPSFHGLGSIHLLDDDADFYFDQKEYQEEMKNLQKEMEQLQKELQKIKEKLE